MKKNYFITNSYYHDIYAFVILYIILFIIVYFFLYETDIKGLIMTVISFVFFIIMIKQTIKIMSKKEGLHHNYLENIFILKEEKVFWGIYILVIIIFMFIIHPLEKKMIIFDVIILILSYLLLVIIKQLYSQGMYIDEKGIYYIMLKRHYLDVNNIIGIKIERAQFNSRGSINYWYNKYSDSYKHCMLFLNRIDDNMDIDYYGSIGFEHRFPGSVITETIYDAEVIDYLKQLNPNIIVMLDIR